MDIAFAKRCFNVKTIPEISDHSCRMQLGVRQGTGEALVYELTPAVLFAFFTFRGKGYQLNKNRRSHIWEINYCIRGRAEHILNDGTLLYLGKEDLTFTPESVHTPEIVLPTGYYQGVGIVIDWRREKALGPVLPAVADFDIQELIRKFRFCSEEMSVPLSAGMENFYQIPAFMTEEDRIVWLRLRVRELLFYLHRCPLEKAQHKNTYERQQIDIVKEVHKELIGCLAQRPNIEDLAKKHYISATTLKNIFKEVYGKPIGAYMKEYRMQVAAQELIAHSVSIHEISQHLGYRSTGKFCAAFKEIMGCTPAVYCKTHSPVNL